MSQVTNCLVLPAPKWILVHFFILYLFYCQLLYLFLDGEAGFEPAMTEPKSVVLPATLLPNTFVRGSQADS